MMKIQSEVPANIQDRTWKQYNSEELVEQISFLSEWRSKAVIQLEYFRMACTLYNFYDTEKINELLNTDRNQDMHPC